jgi:hypothetical protein
VEDVGDNREGEHSYQQVAVEQSSRQTIVLEETLCRTVAVEIHLWQKVVVEHSRERPEEDHPH